MIARPCLLLLLAATAVAQDAASDLLRTLSLEEKAGQLFMSWSLSRSDRIGDTTNHERLRRWVHEAQLGGVILSLGTVDDAAALIPTLQAEAKVPLLLAGDFEGGVWYRLQGGSEFGNQMLVGATESAALAEAMGRGTAQEAKALGFHWLFAPVLDVNSNPQNPIINVRSFGEDPELVARLGCAFARGVRSEGLLACGKHFPGHGDVDSDSHLALPTVPGDSARLHAVELLPFARAAKEGLEAVMTGHLAVPGLGEDPALPATLSSRILGSVLRDELGFTGLIVTDALEMGGVKNAFPPGEVAVRALLAGADVLLMPPDPLLARAAVVDAVRSARVPMARLDDAVLRILRSKQQVGLLAGKGRVAADWRQHVHTAAGEQVADAIAARGLTLVRCRGDALPVPSGKAAAPMLLVSLVDEDEGQDEALAQDLFAGGPGAFLRLSAASDAGHIADALLLLAKADRVVLSLHLKVQAFPDGIGVPPSLRPVLDALRDEQQIVAVSFGNPYLIQHLPKIDAYIAAFVGTERVERRVAAALRGEASLVGRLPVSIPGIATAGTGLTQLVGGDLPRVLPATQDLDPALAANLRTLLQRSIDERAFPGAVCVVARRGQIVAEVAVGKTGYGEGEADVTLATRYDLASLTKVCATTPAVLRLLANGKLSLDDAVQKWLPAFVGAGKERVTIRHLLAHQAGLPPFEPYFRTKTGKEPIVAAAAAEALATEPGSGVVYSDLGFVLLMAVVEAASGEPFATFVTREVLTPFGMTTAAFAPTSAPPIDAAPTENDPDRGGLLRGYVHDENAFAMGGISGHAGLFASAGDVLRFGVALLAGGRGVLPRELVAAATTPAGIGDDVTRGLGLQLLQRGGYGGAEVPAGTFGHTGFTGTSLWCDPRHDLCVVLLTNRVCPTRANNRIAAVRRAVHDLVLAALR